jgi:hypothetical protein
MLCICGFSVASPQIGVNRTAIGIGIGAGAMHQYIQRSERHGKALGQADSFYTAMYLDRTGMNRHMRRCTNTQATFLAMQSQSASSQGFWSTYRVCAILELGDIRRVKASKGNCINLSVSNFRSSLVSYQF